MAEKNVKPPDGGNVTLTMTRSWAVMREILVRKVVEIPAGSLSLSLSLYKFP